MNFGQMRQFQQEFPEPERYELAEGPTYHFEMNRREFTQLLGAGLLISVAIPDLLAQRSGGENRSQTIAERLHIGRDGAITVLTSKVEVGQGSRTQLTQAAAEELRVPIETIRFIMADTAVVPDDGGTAGSRTTPSSVPAIRRGCAAARQLLLETAAAKFNVDISKLSVRDGKVVGAGSESFGYADLLGEGQENLLKREVAAGVTMAEVAQWQVLGKPALKVGGREIVTGRHQYASDIQRPGMVYGCVLRPVSYGAQLESIDLAPAQAMDGVTAVRDGDFVGFTAPTSFQATLAREAAGKTATWKTAPHPSSEELSSYLRAHASTARPRRDVSGTPDEIFKTAQKVLRQCYEIAYIQHAPMEPRAAVAEWSGGNLTVWTGSQQPSRVREDLARTLRIPREKVRVIIPDTGGGFGGKHSGEAAVEAARLALAANKPVSLRWTREEEFTWAYFRPAGVIDLAGALDEKGGLAAWEQVNFNSGGSALATPYAIANTASEFKSCDAPLRAGSYRALASTANIFARECFMDELAAAAGHNPLAFRLQHLKNDRLRDVLVQAAERFDWKKQWQGNKSGQKIGVGLACGTEKGSYAAACVKIEVDEQRGAYRVLEIVEAYECGAIQNPLNLQAQVEGCVLQGLGAVLHEEMTFKDGKILNARFSKYRVPRFKDVPRLETILVNRPDLPSVGAGETPIVAVAPALGNALFNATGIRIRSLPLRNNTWKPA